MGKKYKARFFFLFFVPICLLVVFLSTLLVTSPPVSAGDELYLTGILKSVDVKSGTIVVDVLSQSCPGLRRFSVDGAAGLQGSEGVKFSFSINSSSCKGNVIYTVISGPIRNGG